MSFAPTDVAGLLLWLDAAAISGNDGDPIAAWTDASGHGYSYVQASASLKPLLKVAAINSRKALLFDGANDRLTLSGAGPALGSGTSGYSAFIVAQPVSPSDTYGVVWVVGPPGTHNLYHRADVQKWTWYFNADRVTTRSAPFGAVSMVSATQTSGGSLNLYVNGNTPDTFAATLSANMFGTDIGDDPGSETFHGYICEILVYPGVLSATDRQNIEGYLAWKWGSQALLPSNHPWYAVDPNYVAPPPDTLPSVLAANPPVTSTVKAKGSAVVGVAPYGTLLTSARASGLVSVSVRESDG